MRSVVTLDACCRCLQLLRFTPALLSTVVVVVLSESIDTMVLSSCVECTPLMLSQTQLLYNYTYQYLQLIALLTVETTTLLSRLV